MHKSRRRCYAEPCSMSTVVLGSILVHEGMRICFIVHRPGPSSDPVRARKKKNMAQKKTSPPAYLRFHKPKIYQIRWRNALFGQTIRLICAQEKNICRFEAFWSPASLCARRTVNSGSNSHALTKTSKSRKKDSAVGSIRQLRSSFGAWTVHKKMLQNQ